MADQGQDQAHLDTEEGQDTTLDRLVAEASKEPDAKEEPQVDPNDTDAVEEAAALKALADEEAKEKAEADKAKAGQAEDQGAGDGDGKTADQPQDGKKPGPMIPKARFDEARQKDQEKIAELQAAAAYWKGQADARKESGATPEAEPEKPTPQQQISALRAEAKALAARVSAGTLDFEEYEDKRQALLDQELAIRDEMRKPPEAPQSQASLSLEQMTAKLEEDHPYVAHLSKSQLSFLTVEAVERLAAEGVNLPRGNLNEREQYQLRAKVAELSDTYGPAMTGKTIQKPEPQPNGRPAMSKQAQNLKQKLQAAQDAPPDLTAAGRGGAPMEYTDAQIMAMSQEELDALPVSVLEKIMARQAQ